MLAFAVLLCLRELCVKLRQFAVTQLGGKLVIGLALSRLYFGVGFFYFRFDVGNLVYALLFVFPLRFHGAEFFSQVGKLFLNVFKSVSRQFVRLLFECGFFYFKLHYTSGNFIHFLRHGIDFGSYHRARLVHQVDCLVGEKAVGYITV